MILRIIILTILSLINLAFSTSAENLLAIRGVLPSFTIILITCISLLRGSLEGAYFGGLSGMLYDIFIGPSLGTTALIFMLLGAFLGRGGSKFFRENYVLPLLNCFFAVLAAESAFFVIYLLFNGYFNYFYFFAAKIVPEAVYSALFCLPVYRISYGLNEVLEERERRKRRVF